MKPPYFLTAILKVRIYFTDKAKLSSREMIQWLQYLRYAGVEHVYVYDAYVHRNESQKSVLRPFIESGYVTYTNWSAYAWPYSTVKTQVSAYQDCIDKYGNDSVQTAIDIDEYPFNPVDTSHGFLQRFLRPTNIFSDSLEGLKAEIAELSMNNFLFLGQPLDDNIHPLLIDRIWRRTPKPSNHFVKPIYRVNGIAKPGVHRNHLKRGLKCKEIPSHLLRMNHYWGARLQNWGPDTKEILSMTIPDDSMKAIIGNITDCLFCLDEDLMYKTRWF